jgi:hypothetical protein
MDCGTIIDPESMPVRECRIIGQRKDDDSVPVRERLFSVTVRMQLGRAGAESGVASDKLVSTDAPGYSIYRTHKEPSDGATTREVIETNDWLIGRVVRMNGGPLTADQERREEKRLKHLLTDSQALQKERDEQQNDERLMRDLFKSLLQAFFHEYAGVQTGEEGAELARLKFRSNPSFRPPSRNSAFSPAWGEP